MKFYIPGSLFSQSLTLWFFVFLEPLWFRCYF